MNSTRRPILSLKAHRLVPIRHRFAFWGENLGFYRAHHPIALPGGTKASIPSSEPRLGAAGTSLQAWQQKLKSP